MSLCHLSPELGRNRSRQGQLLRLQSLSREELHSCRALHVDEEQKSSIEYDREVRGIVDQVQLPGQLMAVARRAAVLDTIDFAGCGSRCGSILKSQLLEAGCIAL